MDRGTLKSMTLDFSEILFTDAWQYRNTPPPVGLNGSDAAIVRWFQRVVEHRRDGSIELENVAWFAARFLCLGGIVVWLGQEQELLADGLADFFADCAEVVPEPWSGFLRWASDPDNTVQFLNQPPYVSEEPFDERPLSRAARRRALRPV